MACPRDVFARVFLLIENRLLRESLVRLLRKRPDLNIVGQSSRTESIPTELSDSRCDVVLVDQFHTMCPPAAPLLDNQWVPVGIHVVLIGMEEDEEQFVRAVRAGVTGYLLKDASAGDVIAAVRAVTRGEAVCPPRLCLSLFRLVAAEMHETPMQRVEAKSGLTFRQQQLVSLVAKGLTNKEIASKLNLSEFTVRNHIHRIMKQVDADSRQEAVETIRASGYPMIS